MKNENDTDHLSYNNIYKNQNDNAQVNILLKVYNNF
jgi:hypothetical protein